MANPIERLRYHVSGAIERGEKQAIAGIPAQHSSDAIAYNRAARLAAYSQIVIDARRALQAIADCSESDCARYVAAVDAIAIDALIALDCALEDMPA